MRQILLTTLLLDILGCLLTGVFSLFNDGSIQSFFYVALLTFGSILIPTFLGVLLFQIVKKKIIFSNCTKTFGAQILVMILLLAVGLFLWALADVILWPDQVTIENVKNDFHSQFSGFAIAGIFMSIAIPFVDLFLKRKAYAKK